MSRLLAAQRALTTPSWVKNDLSRKAQANPSLDLRFADNKSLTDATTGQNLVTFTRASSGTYVDSQGVIRTATTNLLLRSEEFNDASWAKSGSTTVSANSVTSPSGTTTADTIIFGNTSDNIYQNVATTASTTYTFSVWLRAQAGTFKLKIARTNTLTWATASVSPELTLTTSWQRYSLTFTTGASDTASGLVIGCESLTPYLLPSAGSIYAWGAQLEASSTVGEYIPTTSTINSAPRFDHNPTTGESLGLLVEESRTNLLTYSEDVSQWASPFNTTLTTNSIAAPDGATTADRLLETTATNLHTCDGTAFTFVTGTTYTYSVFVKPIGNRNFEIAFPATVFTARFARFTLSGSGSVQGTDAGVTASISSLQNGWYRCVATSTCASGAGSRIGNFVNDSSNSRSYTGDTSAGIYIWGAQLEAGAFPTSYIPTTTATVTRSADVASITGSNFGVSRTNLLLRSEEFDNAIWGPVAGTVTANAETSPANTLTADKLIAANGGPVGQLAQGVTIASGATVTGSVYAKAGGFDRLELVLLASNNTTPYGRSVFNLNTGVVTTAAFTANGGTNASSTVQALSNGWYRFSVTVTYPAVTSAGMRLVVSNSDSSNGDGVKGVFLWGSQLETGSAATAYIPTTSAAVTVVDSPWYRQDEGTVFAESRVQDFTVTNFSRIASLDRGDATANFAAIVRSSAVSRVEYSVFAGTGQAVGLQPNITLASGSTVRSAFVYRTDDFLSAANGILSTADTTGSVPTSLTTLGIGMQGNGALPFNGTIRRLTYWPQRLSNSTLASITQ